MENAAVISDEKKVRKINQSQKLRLKRILQRKIC